MSTPGDGSGGPSVVDCAGLTDLLRRQHEELRSSMDRIPQLQGCARADVFLQVRRQLAVHSALEQLVVASRTGKETDLERLDREIEAAELLEHDSPEFDLAFARVVRAQGRHVRAQEQDHFGNLAGALTEDEQAAVETAVRLWEGRGEAYLGISYDHMRSVARQQLRHPEESDPGPTG